METDKARLLRLYNLHTTQKLLYNSQNDRAYNRLGMVH